MKKIVICMNVDEKSFNSLSKIEDHLDLSDSNVCLMHIWSVEAYPLEDHHVAAFYPNKEQTKSITEKMQESLHKQMARFRNLRSNNFQVEVRTSASPKREMVNYLKEHNIDMVIVLTPQKDRLKNFFHSSFTNYLAAHAACDLMMIRQ